MAIGVPFIGRALVLQRQSVLHFTPLSGRRSVTHTHTHTHGKHLNWKATSCAKYHRQNSVGKMLLSCGLFVFAGHGGDLAGQSPGRGRGERPHARPQAISHPHQSAGQTGTW